MPLSMLPAALLLLLGISLHSSVEGLSSKQHRVVCTTNYMPISLCKGYSVHGFVEDYSGYEIELFKRWAVSMATEGHTEWSEGNWSFRCFDVWDEMLGNLSYRVKDERNCDVVVAGVTVSESRTQPPLSLKFAYPSLKTGRRILALKPSKDFLWLFLRPFCWELWLAYFATGVVVAMCIFALETEPSKWEKQSLAECLRHFCNIQWAATGMAVRGIQQLAPRSVAGRIVALGYAFVTLILINMYIASLTATLQERAAWTGIRSLGDLAHVPTGVSEVDYDMMITSMFLWSIHKLVWKRIEDGEWVVQALQQKVYKALILDAPFSNYQVGHQSNLQLVGGQIMPLSYSFTFPGDTKDAYLQLVNTHLKRLEESGVYASLQEDYINRYTDPKSEVTHVPAFCTHVPFCWVASLDEIGGLWIIFGSCVGVGVLIHLAKLAYRLSGSFSSLSSESDLQTSDNGIQRTSEKGTIRTSDKGRRPSDKGSSVTVSTTSEDLQAMGLQMATQDDVIQGFYSGISIAGQRVMHLPFVIAATLDARARDLRAVIGPSQPPPTYRHVYQLCQPDMGHVVSQLASSSNTNRAPLNTRAPDANFIHSSGNGFILPKPVSAASIKEASSTSQKSESSEAACNSHSGEASMRRLKSGQLKSASAEEPGRGISAGGRRSFQKDDCHRTTKVRFQDA